MYSIHIASAGEWAAFMMNKHGDTDAQPSLTLLTVRTLIPLASPSYRPPVLAKPPLYTAFCERIFFFASSYFCRFFTRGLRTDFERCGVRPLFLRIARVRERGPFADSSLPSRPTLQRRSGQLTRIPEKLGRRTVQPPFPLHAQPFSVPFSPSSAV